MWTYFCRSLIQHSTSNKGGKFDPDYLVKGFKEHSIWNLQKIKKADNATNSSKKKKRNLAAGN